MPSAYTADVGDGTITDLAPFALQLARGMGALIMMRDEPLSAPIPEKFEPSSYHADRLKEAKAERDRIVAMSDAAADEAAEAELQEVLAGKAEYFARKQAQRERYDAMIEKVRAWEGAPEGIKEFALDQLQSSREFDCPDDGTYYREVCRQEGPAWRALKLSELNRQIQRHADEDVAERLRTNGRNAWLAQLRQSLGLAAASPEASNG